MTLEANDVPKLEFEFQVTLKKVARRAKKVPKSEARTHPAVRTLVLAHRIEAMIREGVAKTHADAARAMGLSRARIAQITALLLLSPAIQEAVLEAPLERLASMTVRQLNAIAAEPDWEAQSECWAKVQQV